MAESVKHPKGRVEDMAAPFVVNGSVVVDVGANIGRFSTWAAKLVGERGKVLAIEPDPRCDDKGLNQLLTTYPQVTRYRGAVGAWSRPGVATLYQAPESAASTLIKASLIESDQRRASTLTVPVTRLDDLIGRADLVKIDAQGMDHQVLQGAGQLLETCPAWIVECWSVGLAAAQSSPRAMWHTFLDAGFTVCFADGLVITEDTLAQWLQTDQVFVNWLATR